MRFNANAPISPLTKELKNKPIILARKGIEPNPGIDISPFSITSPNTIAPPAVNPTITILPTSIILMLKDFSLFSGSFRKLIASFMDL
jgi:hypothetical protein